MVRKIKRKIDSTLLRILLLISVNLFYLLKQEKPFQTIAEVVKAFKSALLNVVPSKKASETSYRVEGSDCILITSLFFC